MPLTNRERACYGPRNAKPAGSVEWCWQTIDLLKIRWQRKDFTEKQFEETLTELRQQEVWQVVPPEQPYGSLDALLKAEIGCTQAEAKRQLVAEKTHQGERTDFDNVSKLSQPARAKHNGIGIVSQRRLDHLAASEPALLAAVQAGTLSISRAYQLAKGIQPETPLTTLHRVWRKVSPDDRLRFLSEMLTPNERRALLLGFEEDLG